MRLASFNPQEKVFYCTKKCTHINALHILLYLTIKEYFRSNYIICMECFFQRIFRLTKTGSQSFFQIPALNLQNLLLTSYKV